MDYIEYDVQDGDTLSLVSKKVYGKDFMWRTIHRNNKELKNDPDAKIKEDTLIIPILIDESEDL